MSPHARFAPLLTLLVFFLLVCVVMTSRVRAQASPRVATVSTLFGGDQPAVLVGGDRAWVPTLTTQVPLRLCAGGHCDAVRRVEQCAVPRCPGDGSLAIAEHPIFPVADYPTDRVGFSRERTLLSSEPALAALVALMREHPEGTPPPPVHIDLEWLDEHFLGWRVEVGANAALGFVAPGGGAVGGEARTALRYSWKPDGGDEDFLAIMFGNAFGPELTVRGLDLPGGNGGSAFSLGVDFAASYTARHWSVRAPGVYSTLVPELGVIFRDGYQPAFYMGWSAPVSVLVDPRIALEVRVSGLMVDDWVAGDDVAFLGLLTAGLVIR